MQKKTKTDKEKREEVGEYLGMKIKGDTFMKEIIYKLTMKVKNLEELIKKDENKK